MGVKMGGRHGWCKIKLMSTAPPPRRSTGTISRLARMAIWAAAAALLATVFSAYLNPHLVVDLANRVWACF